MVQDNARLFFKILQNFSNSYIFYVDSISDTFSARHRIHDIVYMTYYCIYKFMSARNMGRGDFPEHFWEVIESYIFWDIFFRFSKNV